MTVLFPLCCDTKASDLSRITLHFMREGGINANRLVLTYSHLKAFARVVNMGLLFPAIIDTWLFLCVEGIRIFSIKIEQSIRIIHILYRTHNRRCLDHSF